MSTSLSCITIKDRDGNHHVFRPRPDTRMELSISGSGYVMVYDGTTCVHKEPLNTIKSVHYKTPLGDFVSYTRESWENGSVKSPRINK